MSVVRLPSGVGVRRSKPNTAPRAAAGKASPSAPASTIITIAFLYTRTRMAQYIYTMNRVSKVVPPKRVILRDISLSFFPGAKIGVLGLNGSGKSSLLKIMAGLDANIDGEARPQSGIRIGYLPQEPELDPAMDERAAVAGGERQDLQNVQRFNEMSAKFAEPMSDTDQGRLAVPVGEGPWLRDAAGGWELERKL